MCLWRWTVLKMWSPKHSSFLCRLNRYKAPHSYNFRRPGLLASSLLWPRKPPEAWRRSTMWRATATSRLQSFCSQKGLQWTPRGAMARGLNPGSRRQTSSLRLGAPQKAFPGLKLMHFRHFQNVFPGLKFEKQILHFGQMFGKVVSLHPKKRRDRWLQCNMPICVENGCKVAVGSI